MTDFSEPAEYPELRAAVRQITQSHGPAEYTRHARTSTPMAALWRDLGKAGFIGINVPEEFGGGGAGMSELALVAEESAAAGCPLLTLLVSSAIGVEILRRHGTPEQQREWLPKLADGGTKIVFAITEPDAGSNSHRLATTARRDGAEYVISGQKYYISGVDEAAAIITVTRTGTDPVTGKGQLSLFVVPIDAPGLSYHQLEVAAQIPDRQYTVFFDDVRVPDTALIGVEGQGFRPLFDGLNPERISAAAIGVGIGRYALATASRYVRDRQVWGKPLGTHQAVAHPLAKAAVDIELAGLMTAKAAWLYDQGQPAGEVANMAKYAAATASVAAVDAAIQVHGGNGLSVEYGLVPLWGMARLLSIAPVNNEMVLNYIAQHVLDLPRSY
ncbi:MAG TPA: acyl-CoA dehydrogenase family protein [Nakamurella sp.]